MLNEYPVGLLSPRSDVYEIYIFYEVPMNTNKVMSVFCEHYDQFNENIESTCQHVSYG